MADLTRELERPALIKQGESLQEAFVRNVDGLLTLIATTDEKGIYANYWHNLVTLASMTEGLEQPNNAMPVDDEEETDNE